MNQTLILYIVYHDTIVDSLTTKPFSQAIVVKPGGGGESATQNSVCTYVEGEQ